MPDEPATRVSSVNPVTCIVILVVVGIAAVGMYMMVWSVGMRWDYPAFREATTVSDIRTMISAQAAYQVANGGFYAGDLRCLSVPTGPGCIPNYPPNGPTFLDSELTSLTPKKDYARRFTPGPKPPRLNTNVSGSSSVTSYVYSAVPVKRLEDAVRGFGGDSTGLICFSREGVCPAQIRTPTEVRLDTSSPTCTPLQ